MKRSNVSDDLKICSGLGFSGIELRFDMLSDYLTSHSIRDFKKLLAAGSLELSYLNAVYMPQDILSAGVAASWAEVFERDLELAAAIGVPGVVLVPPLLPERDVTVRYADKYPDLHQNPDFEFILAKMIEKAQAYSLKIAFEPVGFGYCSFRSVASAYDLVERLNSDSFGLLIDIYNMYMEDGNTDYDLFSEFRGDKIFQVQICDAKEPYRLGMSQADRTMCGQGVLDVKKFINKLLDIQYPGSFSVELFNEDFWARDPEEVMTLAYETGMAVMPERMGQTGRLF